MPPKTVSLNARVAAIGFPLGALSVHVLNQYEASLIPLRLIAISVLIFGVWAFADEMGLRKPLNRAGFISFGVAMAALAVAVMEPARVDSRYLLVYAYGTLLCILIWSAAFLHRQKSLKIAGAAGVLASILPVLILIGGHISIGFGALLGIGLLYNPPIGTSLLGTTPLNFIEAVFVLWSIVAAVFLWQGRVGSTVQSAA